MNRDLVGCSTESACGVGLVNRQDAQIICECTNSVNYNVGKLKQEIQRFKAQTIRGRYSVGICPGTKTTRPTGRIKTE